MMKMDGWMDEVHEQTCLQMSSRKTERSTCDAIDLSEPHFLPNPLSNFVLTLNATSVVKSKVSRVLTIKAARSSSIGRTHLYIQMNVDGHRVTADPIIQWSWQSNLRSDG